MLKLDQQTQIHVKFTREEEELRSPEKAGVNTVYVRITSLPMPMPWGNGIRCKTTSSFENIQRMLTDSICEEHGAHVGF